MKASPARIVLAFYSSEEGHADNAFRALKRTEKVCLAGPDPSTLTVDCKRFYGLKIEGETLLVVTTESSRIEDVVKTLRLEGSPAIFAVRPDFGLRDYQTDKETEGQPEEFGAQSRAEILDRLKRNQKDLEAARCDLLEATRLDHALTPAAEWLLDNAYLIRTQILEVRRHLPKDYKSAPHSLEPGKQAGNVNDLAHTLAASTDRALTENNIRDALRDYQASTPLTIAELWAFPLFLRIALIETLTKIATRVSHAQELRESAYLWANRLANSSRVGDGAFASTLKNLENEPVASHPYFVTALAEQLQDEESALGPAQHWIEAKFNQSLIDVVRTQHNNEAAQVVSTANAFTSLRSLSRLDFTKIFEEVSLVEIELRRDPAGIYGRSDFPTRDLCRNAVERTSRFSGAPEREVAARAVALAAAEHDKPGSGADLRKPDIQKSDIRKNSVTWFLLSDGITQLEYALGARVPARVKTRRLIYRHPTFFYITALTVLTVCLNALTAVLARDAGVHGFAFLSALIVLSLFPLSELSVQIVNALVISLLPPDLLPKMNFKEGIPPENATLVVVPMMLSSLETIHAELEKLEVRFLANRNENLFYSLFSDFLDAPEQTTPEDAGLLRAIKAGIEELNARYAENHFLLFHRPRTWSENEEHWIGRERKRGKLEELNAFLCGAGYPGILQAGRLPLPIAFVITLDADTQLPVESARCLIETISHPLNRVEIDPDTRIRKRGYTIIQPRVGITLPGATATRFTRVFADATGTDPYSQTVSDAQQDLFLEAIFHGKAIYDVRAFHTIVGGLFPPDTLLSHDLIEGAHAGVGLATDIELFEHLPTDYPSFAARQHRWTRGDWQISQWTRLLVPGPDNAPQRNSLSLINRWRILDNLRRSLVPFAALLLLVTGWLFSPAPKIWSLVVAFAVAIPALAPVLDRFAQRLQGSVHRWQGAADDLIRAIVMAAFLPHQAWISIDAISRVLYRRNVSHRHMLEWQTADHARSDAHRHMDKTMRQMLIVSALSFVLGLILIRRREFSPALPFVILWIASPLLMRWLAAPVLSTDRGAIGTEGIAFLRNLSRHTWRFFDDLVSAQSNWLPPDNSQLALRIEVAQRTSPTNIGLWLTSLLSARDFGYVTVDDFCRRSTNTLATLLKMERYEGHLLNWYRTDTLEPLNPRYVSTVDSGNLIASLWVLGKGCGDILHSPVIGAAALRGMNDTLTILEKTCADDPSSAVAIHGLRRLLRGSKDGHELIAHFRLASGPIQKLEQTQRWHASKNDERVYWMARLSAEFNEWIATADRYLHWMDTLSLPPDDVLREISRPASRAGARSGKDLIHLRRRALHHVPSLADLAEGSVNAVAAFLGALTAIKAERGLMPEVSRWLDQLTTEYAGARLNATETLASLHTIAGQAARLADGINMRFLYDAQRRLFGVGYAVGGPREFSSHYDLLASECRIASLVAIARGDVPVEHWHMLNRPYSNTPGGPALLSWSGTMFEYLMPVLFTRNFSNSMLEGACRDAVARQIEYATSHDIPWGISESAWSALDANQIYQYHAFGVPALALSPVQENDLVVTPYATVLALQIDPMAALENLERLRAAGLEGPMGFYEAIDFTRESKRHGHPGVVIYSYMAHHQGMIMGALNNVLHSDILQRRFHGDLRIRAIESLLFERNPITRLPKEEAHARLSPIRITTEEDAADRTWTEETASPRVHLHGNGRYSLTTTNSGGGFSKWNDFDVTRWRSDPTLDPWGTFIYIRDIKSEEIWATTHKPFTGKQGESSVRFAADRVELRRRVSGIETVLEVTVAAEDDVELRRVIVTNRSLRNRQLEFTSYMELAMAPHGADKAHPAFAKMFIETEYPEPGILLAHRRPRSSEEGPIWTGHVLVGAPGAIQCETDRLKFLGRGNNAETAVALRNPLTGTLGTVIDPVFSLRCRIALDPRERRELAFIVIAGETREKVLELAHKYSRPESVTRAFEMAWTRAQLEFRFLRIGPGAAHRYQELASQLLYPSSRLRPPLERLSRNKLGQSSLWAYGISGDLPMVVVTASDGRHMSLVREVLLAHAYWRLRGFKSDLIILNQEAPGYDQPLRHELLRQIEAHSSESGIDKPGGVFLRDWHQIPEDNRNLIIAAAGMVLNGNRGPLQQQLTAAGDTVPLPLFTPVGHAPEEPSTPLPFLELPYFNGLGGFTPDGKEYAIYLKPGVTTPAPWANVMANDRFGTLVTESGLGYTWLGNSQTNRLTPWHNDPVSDPQSEIIYLRDEESGAVWTPTALPAREKDAYRTRHGHGYTVFEHNSHAIGQELTVFVPVGENGVGDPVKICRLKLRNESSRPRKLTATWSGAWVLGSVREDQQLHVLTSHDEPSGAIMARQYWTGAFTSQIAFAASSPRATSWTGDRTQFLGRNGSLAKPEGLERARLDNRTGTGADPAAALQVSITLDRGAEFEVIFLLGETDSRESMKSIIGRFSNSQEVDRALQETKDWWNQTLGAVQVHTPVLSTDFLLNGWLLYQSLSCRFWGRSGLYQSSGALGFRDQLQDCLALLFSNPQLTRKHILKAAARQFLEGDVQHWWHAETGMGVRTRCSDDLLWLPFVVCHYVEVTGDTGILDEVVPFIEAPVLAPHEQERMFTPPVSQQTAPLWRHCGRAIEHSLQFGRHGLPLIGNGDWNDGMNLVGAEGKGESVWLALFQANVLEAFANLWEPRDAETRLVAGWRQRAGDNKKTVNSVAWDGEWYMRGYFDDGSSLGSHNNAEARIDSLPQSWSVISGSPDPARSRQAMLSAETYLVREKDKLVLLLSPPFDHSSPNPGYIMGYPPGLRENGGQYTHGALWLAMAWARLGEGDRAVRLLQMMNPVELTRNPAAAAHYRGEPYVVAADVSLGANRVGQAGWTWYTGSAAWMYRVWLEEVLGFRVHGTTFTVEPAIPADWPGFDLSWKHLSSTYNVKVVRYSGEPQTLVDGEPVSGGVPLIDDGRTRNVEIRISLPCANPENERQEAALTSPLTHDYAVAE